MKKTSKGPAQRLDRLERSFLHDWFRLDPIAGSEHGKNDGCDTKLPEGGAEFIQEEISLLRRHEGLFDRVNPARLDAPGRVRLDAARQWLRLRRFEVEKLRRWEYVPDTPQVIGRAIFQILGRSYAPLRARMGRIQERLAQFPKYIRRSMRRLRRRVRSYTEHELETITRLPAFFHNLKEIARIHLPLTPLKHLLRVIEEVQSAVEEYTNWLIIDVLSHCEEDRRLLPAELAAWLRHRGVSERPEELEQQAEEEAARARQRMREIGRRIRRKVPVEDVRDRIRSNHPSDFDAVLKYVREQLLKIRAFVDQSGFATIPRGEILYAVETPMYLRHLIGFAGYWPPAPFASKSEAYFFLTPGDCDSDRLKEFSFPALAGYMARFAYPGRHLFHAGAAAHASPLRRVMGWRELPEGWADYAESRMAELGYDDTPSGRFMQSLAALRRAVFAQLDLRIAAGRIGAVDAVNSLIDELGMDRVAAEAEVRRMWEEPLRHAAALAGKNAIDEAKKRVRDRLKAAFTEKIFHDLVLSSGLLPANLLAKELDWKAGEILAKMKGRKKGAAGVAASPAHSR